MKTRTLSNWTASTVLSHVAKTPNMDWSFETDVIYQERYVRPISEFGFEIRLDECKTPTEDWHPDLMPIRDVDLAAVVSSTQVEGVCLDVIDHYLNGGVNLDPNGWFNNQIPVLILRDDDTYTIRDGNHRVIAAVLRGDTTITAHVVD